MRKTVLAGSLLLLCVSSTALWAQTNVPNTITTDTTWTVAGSPYLVVSHVLVNPSVTLTVQPGVVVKFTGAFRLDVRGRLLANGTSGSPILFTSNESTPTPGFWYYINYFQESYGNQMSYATISYGGHDAGEVDTAVLVQAGSPSFNHVTISNSGRRGLKVDNGASATFTSGTLSGNAWEGAKVQGSSTLTISGTSILNNGDYAISKRVGSQVLGLTGMTISGNGAGTGNGIEQIGRAHV